MLGQPAFGLAYPAWRGESLDGNHGTQNSELEMTPILGFQGMWLAIHQILIPAAVASVERLDTSDVVVAIIQRLAIRNSRLYFDSRDRGFYGNERYASDYEGRAVVSKMHDDIYLTRDAACRVNDKTRRDSEAGR